MKLPKFLTAPPGWYREVMFWLSAILVPVNLALLLISIKIPGSQDLQRLVILNGCLGVVGALTAWFLGRSKPR